MARLISLALLLLAISGAASATRRGVEPGELKAALATAEPGDTLELAPGIYRGRFTVDTPLQILGGSEAILEGPGSGNVLTLAADGIQISGVTVRGSGNDLAEDDAVVLIREVSQVTVARCRVEARAFGIYLQAGGGHRIIDNEVVGDTALPLVRRGNGIHMWKTVGNEVRGNQLIDVRDGVYLSFAHDNLIQENQGTALRYGIHYMYSERNTLTGNRFSGCTGGIALMFSMKNRIEANETVGNQQFGILCQLLEHSQIENNRIEANGRGLYLQNSANNRFANNQIIDNGVGTYLTAGSERNRFAANRFAGNLVQVFEDHAGDNVFHDQGRGNFWSDYAGFDWNGDGVGETPYQLQTATSALLARRPVARWFWMSPALALLDWWDAQLAPSVSSFDPFPLVGESWR